LKCWGCKNIYGSDHTINTIGSEYKIHCTLNECNFESQSNTKGEEKMNDEITKKEALKYNFYEYAVGAWDNETNKPIVVVCPYDNSGIRRMALATSRRDLMNNILVNHATEIQEARDKHGITIDEMYLFSNKAKRTSFRSLA